MISNTAQAFLREIIADIWHAVQIVGASSSRKSSFLTQN
jgi:hypothetical protein